VSLAWSVCKCGEPLRLLELPTPEPTGTEVLIEVTHCGVCHSDLHIWDGYYELGGGKRLNMSDRGMTLPIAMGHEIVGRVAKLGPRAVGVAVGDLRIVYPWVGCGVCEDCRAERDNMCPSLRSLGVYQNGGYGTHVVAPHPRHLIPYGDLDPAVAATFACSGITVYAAATKVMPLRPDEPLLLVGAGGLGLNAIAMLRAMGHRQIVVVDISAEKRAAAIDAGATKVIDGNGDDVTARIVEACGGPVKAIIDFVNGSATARFSFDALRKGGKLVQVGLFGGDMALPLPVMATRALTIQGSLVGTPQDLRDVVRLALDSKLAALPVEIIPQSRANEALMRLRGGGVTGRLVLRTEAA
jgi:propanol-preferring alcohol dehydrogenase